MGSVCVWRGGTEGMMRWGRTASSLSPFHPVPASPLQGTLVQYKEQLVDDAVINHHLTALYDTLLEQVGKRGGAGRGYDTQGTENIIGQLLPLLPPTAYFATIFSPHS